MVSGRDLYYTMAHNEIWTGKEAERVGNKGKVRVCARRACFFAIDFWLEFNEHKKWGESAMSYLKNTALDQELPQKIRDAASRLTERVNLSFEVSNDIDPLADAELMVEYFLDKKNLYNKGK